MKVIIHLDADAFFASVEAAKNPKLRGLPIITGFERGIATSMSYEAKALGINRADPIFKIKKEFPQVQIVSGDYESYAIYSERMFDIVGQHTNRIDIYSIDECFATIENKNIILNTNHDDEHLGEERTQQEYIQKEWHNFVYKIIEKIQRQIEIELNISVSIGVGATKLIAKIGSKLEKPHGLTIINNENIDDILSNLEVGKLWGIGTSSTRLLQRNNIHSALQFKNIDPRLLKKIANKPLIELWYEINGISKLPFGESHIKSNPKSISRTHSFVATNNSHHIYSELAHNVENACYQLRHHDLYCEQVAVYLKDSNNKYYTYNFKLSPPNRYAHIILEQINTWYDQTFNKKIKYKSTGVTLAHFSNQQSLFQEYSENEEDKVNDTLYKAIDEVNKKYGKHKVHLASADQADKKSKSSYAQIHKIINIHQDGDYKLRHTYLPYLGEAK